MPLNSMWVIKFQITSQLSTIQLGIKFGSAIISCKVKEVNPHKSLSMELTIIITCNLASYFMCVFVSVYLCVYMSVCLLIVHKYTT